MAQSEMSDYLKYYDEFDEESYYWDRLNEEFDKSRHAHREAYFKSKAARQGAARTYWEALARVLAFYADDRNWPEVNPHDEDTPWEPRHHIPQELALALFRIAQDLKQGAISPIISDVVGRGRPPTTEAERTVIAIAVKYILLAKDGVIKDEHPTNHISKVFGVDRRTAQAWVKKYGHGLSRSRTRPDDTFRDQVLHAGDWYRTYGRSSSAVIKRAMSRRDSK